MLDTYWWGNVDRISPEAPVPIVSLQHKELRVGGASNVALNTASLGAKT
ncbi:bifunctional heptose 7-phosphate kinase/heptose 1-phosphate adenyltransferase, partial [Vibrio parahaemolyticus]